MHVIVSGMLVNVIDGFASLPEPWFSIQKYSVCDPPAVIDQRTLLVYGVTVPYAGSPSAGQFA